MNIIPAEVLTEEEKESIIRAAKDQYKDSIKSRRVEAVLVYGVIFSGKAPFFSGWASGLLGFGLLTDYCIILFSEWMKTEGRLGLN